MLNYLKDIYNVVKSDFEIKSLIRFIKGGRDKNKEFNDIVKIIKKIDEKVNHKFSNAININSQFLIKNSHGIIAPQTAKVMTTILAIEHLKEKDITDKTKDSIVNLLRTTDKHSSEKKIIYNFLRKDYKRIFLTKVLPIALKKESLSLVKELGGWEPPYTEEKQESILIKILQIILFIVWMFKAALRFLITVILGI